MGNTDPEVPSKTEKVSSPVKEHGQPSSLHAYHDWAAIQAYYGQGVGFPPPYFSSAVASAHPPHPLMWGPQHMMAPYGTPYAAIYPHGGVYAHPSMAIGPHVQGHGASSSGTSDNMVASPLSMESPAKSSANKSPGLMKKLKGFDGFAVSIGNGNTENAMGDEVNGLSQSTECGPEGSSDGSDGNDAPRKKRGREDMAVKGQEINIDLHNPHSGQPNGSSSKSMRVSTAAAAVAGKAVGTIPLSSMQQGMDLKGSAGLKAKSNVLSVPAVATGVVPAHDGMPTELKVPDERELKRERRKQSNRESARRSRLRKQAETEQLASKVESLKEENIALKTEVQQLAENLEHLRREHSTLMEKLKDRLRRKVKAGGAVSEEMEREEGPPIAIEKNLLSRVNNNTSAVNLSSNGLQREMSEAHEASSSGKLRQLLESNSRADAVAAS